ncbi:MAG: hypothetical protein HRU18_06650 [Pseudoalteromonas sp.]|uniref:hypothetical protein n=1 Tax=Pseudoalteromonas sp. TaxID=53249 RepID=UPI001DE6F5A1|nr:hypothetical protein [Pseudoalteromonas sp.]NRA77869.1 hypothetical protein [Pseudoalteromonas sp.]
MRVKTLYKTKRVSVKLNGFTAELTASHARTLALALVDGADRLEYNEVEVATLANKALCCTMYLDYFNNFLSVAAFADHYRISEHGAGNIIRKGKEAHSALNS